jgi:hypothetical protein
MFPTKLKTPMLEMLLTKNVGRFGSVPNLLPRFENLEKMKKKKMEVQFGPP